MRVDAPADDLVVRPVPALGEEALGEREADAVGEALAERPRRRLHSRRVPELRMARGRGAPLAEAAQLVERQVVAREVERGVLEHRRMAGGEDEAVAVRPGRVGRVVAHDVAVEQVRDRRERHRRTRMPRVRGLDGVHRQGADRVDRQPAVVRAQFRAPVRGVEDRAAPNHIRADRPGRRLARAGRRFDSASPRPSSESGMQEKPERRPSRPANGGHARSGPPGRWKRCARP